MWKFIVTSSLCFFIAIGSAQNKSIPYIDTPLSIDGKLDESIWNELEATTNFYNYAPTDEGLAAQQTVVKFYHDGQHLYIGAVYHDDSPRVQVSSLKRDVPIGLSDGIVIILDVQNQKQGGYYFSLNGHGALVEGLVERINEGFDFSVSWNTVWKGAASVDGSDKVYEMAIPLKALNFDTKMSTFGVQVYTRDIKKNSWTIMSPVKRNYRLFDLRFTTDFVVESLPDITTSRFVVTPSLTANYQKDELADKTNTTVKPSLDVQYNVTSSLKLDATINPDFSQIDVDEQVTNLTRFALFFPERRNFFLENADLFSNLGVEGVNPFYSRRIGVRRDIQFGLKLSGNVTPRTRIGVLNVQTEEEGGLAAQNYGAVVVNQQLSSKFTTTGYIINRQAMDGFSVEGDYNRVTGANLNYKSNNNLFTGVANVGASFNDDVSKKNTFYNARLWYNKRGLAWNAGLKHVGRNYLTDVGFNPRLFNFDAINNVIVRNGYTQSTAGLEYEIFYDENHFLNNIRVLRYSNNIYLDESGDVTQLSHSFNSAFFFKSLASVYYVFNYDQIDLKYGFTPLGTDNILPLDTYNNTLLKIGYNSPNSKRFRYRANIQRGKYFGGNRTSGGVFLNYQLLPFANLELNYDINSIDFGEQGEETFHLARLSTEVFFSTKLSWTNYVQYNTQIDNLNINSRLQWEYRPLSSIFFVVTNNMDPSFEQKNWGVAFKANYRFDF